MVFTLAVPNYGLAPHNAINVLNQGPLGQAFVFDDLKWCVYCSWGIHSYTTTFITAYDVRWVYVGSESDNTLRFSGPGVAGFDGNQRQQQLRWL